VGKKTYGKRQSNRREERLPDRQGKSRGRKKTKKSVPAPQKKKQGRQKQERFWLGKKETILVILWRGRKAPRPKQKGSALVRADKGIEGVQGKENSMGEKNNSSSTTRKQKVAPVVVKREKHAGTTAGSKPKKSIKRAGGSQPFQVRTKKKETSRRGLRGRFPERTSGKKNAGRRIEKRG